jgi:hypothetical protein
MQKSFITRVDHWYLGNFLIPLRVIQWLLNFPYLFGSYGKAAVSYTRVFYIEQDKQHQFSSPSELIAHRLVASDSEIPICMIENITPEYIEALGSRRRLDPAFFMDHATNPSEEELWDTSRYDISHWRGFTYKDERNTTILTLYISTTASYE